MLAHTATHIHDSYFCCIYSSQNYIHPPPLPSGFVVSCFQLFAPLFAIKSSYLIMLTIKSSSSSSSLAWLLWLFLVNSFYLCAVTFCLIRGIMQVLEVKLLASMLLFLKALQRVVFVNILANVYFVIMPYAYQESCHTRNSLRSNYFGDDLRLLGSMCREFVLFCLISQLF